MSQRVVCQTFGALPGQKTGLMTRVRTNVIHHLFMDQYSVYNCVCIYLLYIHIPVLMHVCLKKMYVKNNIKLCLLNYVYLRRKRLMITIYDQQCLRFYYF